ncbi:predicted protein, partial [Nematostella vectensis]
CIRFVKRTTESAYLEIFKGNGCSSFVGTIHSKQRLNLGAGCLTPRVILHELGHALGFHHEHNRPDRDDYVTIMWENITPNYRFAFNKKSPYEVTDLGTPYDYNSIMHYHRYAFSMSGNPTIIVKQSALIGSNKLSEIDIYQMNRLYKCPGGKKIRSRTHATITTGCNFESDLCGFTQETSDDYNWTRSNKKTPTWDSGPDTDHTSGTGFYLYTEASGRKPGNRAVLSRSIPLTGNTCLTFYYHMHGSEMGSLSVNVGGKKVFEKSGPQGKSWTKATINLQGQGQAKLEFVGMIGSGFKSDAGIDDITVGKCQ